MKIAIHHRKGSFSERWIEYCIKNNIDYKIVNAFDSDIINKVAGYDIFMWHHHHERFEDVLTAKRILFALEQAGTTVFPNFNTNWHFDDKVAQKYLFEAINAPLITSYVFFNKKKALEWARDTSYPKVFKLKGGASAKNVKLVNDYVEARKLINQAFNRGFSQFNKMGNLAERFNKFKQGQSSIVDVAKGVGRIFITPKFAKLQAPEKGYIYFQNFIPNNNFDIRVIVIDDKAFAIKRMVRQNDFRASGSGIIIYDKSEIDLKFIELAFSINEKLNSQCIAFDFVVDINGYPLVVEISYGFSIEAYDKCPGYWDKDLNWYQKPFNPQYWMIENLINTASR